MTRRLLASYLTITVLVLAILVIPLGTGFADREKTLLLAGIERDAHAVAALVEDDLEAGRTPALRGLLDTYAADGGRIVIVDKRGISLADSEDPGLGPRDFSTRPEFVAALAGQRAEGVRFSDTLGRSLMYVAIPVTSAGRVYGAVRISYPTAELDHRVRDNWLRLALLSTGILAVIVGVGFVLARGVTRPVQDLQKVTGELSRGKLDARAAANSGAPELRSLAQTVNVMAGRLSRLVASQHQFVADAAHQLRTPLTALRLRLETLEPYLPSDQQPKLDAALVETARLGRLVDSLLVLAAADAQAVAPSPVSVDAVTADRVATWQPAASQAGVRLDYVDGGSREGLAVPGGLEQILDNLISNALQASPPGSVVTVSVGSEPQGATYVRVVDQGPGIDEETAERAFEPFWRAPDARAGTGFGLGLAIAQRLARAAGGSVALRRGTAGGTEAEVTLAGVSASSASAPGGDRRRAESFPGSNPA
ncbi:MAG TPA: sensor histidine kinase [Sporichthya sp.]|nr:sensor histidine kinase [Sporichthya sp.]